MTNERQDEILERFRARHLVADREVLGVIERRAMGSDYGADGYTTREQVDELTRRLELGPSDELLDIGTGRGWPALYLSQVTGCSVVATDVPVEGLRAGARRARADGLGKRASLVAARAEALPFRPGSFDAVVHTDVLC